MTQFTRLATTLALVTLSLTGCYSRNQNPYGYNNGIIAPPATGAYGGYNQQAPQPYYQQYQTPPPAGYGQVYQPNGYQPNPYQPNPSQQYGVPANVASTAPVLQPGTQQFQVAPAAFNESIEPQYDSGPQIQPYYEAPQFQPPAPDQFQDSGFSDQQGNLMRPMQINEANNGDHDGDHGGASDQADQNFTRSQAVMVPVNNTQPATGNGVPIYANGSVQPVAYAPLDQAAIVLPQTQAAFQNRYQDSMLAGNYEPTMSPGTTAGVSVARNSTSPDHDPVWHGTR